MGRGPKRKVLINGIQSRQAKQQSHHFPVDHEYFSPLFTSINWRSSQREKTTHITIKQEKGKLEQKMVYHTVAYNFIVQDAYVNQSCYDL